MQVNDKVTVTAEVGNGVEGKIFTVTKVEGRNVTAALPDGYTLTAPRSCWKITK